MTGLWRSYDNLRIQMCKQSLYIELPEAYFTFLPQFNKNVSIIRYLRMWLLIIEKSCHRLIHTWLSDYAYIRYYIRTWVIVTWDSYFIFLQDRIRIPNWGQLCFNENIVDELFAGWSLLETVCTTCMKLIQQKRRFIQSEKK